MRMDGDGGSVDFLCTEKKVLLLLWIFVCEESLTATMPMEKPHHHRHWLEGTGSRVRSNGIRSYLYRQITLSSNYDRFC